MAAAVCMVAHQACMCLWSMAAGQGILLVTEGGLGAQVLVDGDDAGEVQRVTDLAEQR